MKKSSRILIFWSMVTSVVLSESTPNTIAQSSPSNSPLISKNSPSQKTSDTQKNTSLAAKAIREEKITRDSLDKAFASKGEMLSSLIQLLEPIVLPLKEKIKNFEPCYDHTSMNWMKWRTSQEQCGAKQMTVDEFRRLVISEIENAVVTILEETGCIPINKSEWADLPFIPKNMKWLAIGTLGPLSDIDTIATYVKSSDAIEPEGSYLPKIVAEIRAKSIFDALGIALLGASTGIVFDTESYIDTTDGLNKVKYGKMIQDQTYQSLALTLAFVQVARQLHHSISSSKGEVWFDYNIFNKHFTNSIFMPLLKDAHEFEQMTHPAANLKNNIEKYLPVINHLSLSVKATQDDIRIAKLRGILGTYFPEGYYTQEALAHVCYSDDRYSQLLSTMIAEYWKEESNQPLWEKIDLNQIPAEKIEEFKNVVITPNSFIYAVSALENLGYFFHKLDKQENPYEALKNSAKYFFRVTRALGEYWNVRSMSKDHKEQRYVRQLNVIATQLERFKRGFLPFSSPENIKNLLRNIETFLNRKTEDQMIQERADFIYKIYNDIYMPSSKKIEALKVLLTDYEEIIKFDEKTRRFDLREQIENRDTSKEAKVSDEIKKRGAIIQSTINNRYNVYPLELVSLMNLAIGVDKDSQNMKFQKVKRDSDLQLTQTPMWITDAQSELPPIGQLTKDQFTAFLNGLVAFMRHTLEDFSQTNNLTPQSIGLTQLAQDEINAALGGSHIQKGSNDEKSGGINR